MLKNDINATFIPRTSIFFSKAFLFFAVIASVQLLAAQAEVPSGFISVRTQFIAALGDPKSNSGNNANDWGLWTVDPGPRGVMLSDYESLQESGGKAPAGWTFDENDWWLEEHGLIMEPPQFPLSPGRYLVTGGRSVTTVLTIGLKDPKTGARSWKLDDEAELYDITHLPCRSARYTPKKGDISGSPATAKTSDFPVTPGAEMPEVYGCDKQDYAVLFIIGVESVENA